MARGDVATRPTVLRTRELRRIGGWVRRGAVAALVPVATACASAHEGIDDPGTFSVPVARAVVTPPGARHAGREQHAMAGHVSQHRDHAASGHAAHHTAGHGAAEVSAEARLVIDLGKGSREIVLVIGPMRLPAAGDGMAMRQSPALQAPLPLNAWLVGFAFELVDETGTPLPRHLLHHVNLIRPAQRDLFQPTMQRLAAAGRETAGITLPWPLGIRVRRHEPLMAIAMLHNTEAHDYGNVYVHVRLALRTRGRVGVQPFMMDVIPPPASASWDLPPGRSERSWEGSPVLDARLLGIGAHLHRYGRALILEDVTTGRVLHRSEPLIGQDGEVVAVPTTLFRPAGIRLHANRRYRVTAVYDNPTGVTIADGAMGVFGGIVLPLSAWPAADTTASLYRRDLSARRRH